MGFVQFVLMNQRCPASSCLRSLHRLSGAAGSTQAYNSKSGVVWAHPSVLSIAVCFRDRDTSIESIDLVTGFHSLVTLRLCK